MNIHIKTGAKYEYSYKTGAKYEYSYKLANLRENWAQKKQNKTKKKHIWI